jgi:hypothetical protein
MHPISGEIGYEKGSAISNHKSFQSLGEIGYVKRKPLGKRQLRRDFNQAPRTKHYAPLNERALRSRGWPLSRFRPVAYLTHVRGSIRLKDPAAFSTSEIVPVSL